MEELKFTPHPNSCMGCYSKTLPENHDQLRCNINKYEEAVYRNNKAIKEHEEKILLSKPGEEEFEFHSAELDYLTGNLVMIELKLSQLKQIMRKRSMPALLFR